MRRRWWIALAVIVIASDAGALFAVSSSSSGAGRGRPLVVTAAVTRRTLDNDVTLTGTLSRLVQRTVTAGAASQINDVSVTDGQTVKAGQAIVGVNGREAVAEEGSFPFFRDLGLGDTGQDVLQLDQILAANGFDPGPMSNIFTAGTQTALAAWQAAHGYPSITPSQTETVSVSLQPSSSYKVGAEASVGMTIQPPSGSSSSGSSSSGSGSSGPSASRGTPTVVRLTSARLSTAVAVPRLTIDAVNQITDKGSPAQFIVYASQVSDSPLSFAVSEGGTAPSDEVLAPTGPFSIPAGSNSVELTVPTRENGIVQPDASLTLQLLAGPGYVVGNPATAQTTVHSLDVPKLSLSGGGDIEPGQAVTVTVTADQPPVQATQVALNVGGNAEAGIDYAPLTPLVTLEPGQATVTVTLYALPNDTIETDRLAIISLSPSSAYAVGAVSSATVTILGPSGPAALPVVTLTAGSHYVTKGEPFPVSIGLSRPVVNPLTVTLTYSGTAIDGVDYNPPAGLITITPGTTSLTVEVPTIADNSVEPDKTLEVALVSSTAYRIGTPSSASTTITSANLPTLTITAASSTVTAGATDAFTIRADQAPTKDTSVGYEVVGSEQTGQEFEPLTGTALLRAGQTSVTVPLQTINQDIQFQPTDMIVGHWPIRVGQVFVKAGDNVIPGADLFTLTDTGYTVTLTATPSERTQLAVGQSCTVQLQGASAETTGVISELDDNVTVNATTDAETYSGKIAIGNLGAADGATVTIDVVNQSAANVLSVPIAAVEENGLGQDVVRVFDVSSGHVSQVPVRTGLADSSYIQIDSGLREGQVVIVETDPAPG